MSEPTDMGAKGLVHRGNFKRNFFEIMAGELDDLV